MTKDPSLPAMPAVPDPSAGPDAGAFRIVVPDELDGRRLDRVLRLAFPAFGVRRLRRVFLENAVLVDGVSRQAAFKARAGSVVTMRPLKDREAGGRGAGLPPGLLVVAEGPDYGAVVKPGGLSTASIGPGGGESLEDHLPALFPGRRAIALGRLDLLTSGIVAVAFHEGAAGRFREAEDRGLAEKTYLAVVRGRLAGTLTITNALDTARRKKTRVLDLEADILRHTEIAGLGYDPGTDLTLIRAVIRKGARHQIRAHVAAHGHPIVGDPLYGRDERKARPLFLHHARIIFPGFTAASPPDWATSREEELLLDLGPGVKQALDDVVLANEVGP